MCRKLIFLVLVVLAMGLLCPARAEGAISDPNLMLYYKLDETAGKNVEDFSGYDHHGDLYQWPEDQGFTPGWEPGGGHSGGCLVFFDDTRIEVPKAVLDKVTDGITVSLWLKDAWRVGQDWVFGAGGRAAEESFYVMAAVGTAPDAQVLWRAGNDTNDTLRWDMDGNSVEDLEGWHNWTFVKDEVAGNMRIYLDGSLAASKGAVDNTLINARSVDEFNVGARSWYFNDLKGKMDEFVVYDRALSDDEVLRLYYVGGDMNLGVAWNPDPENGGQNFCDDVVLSWTAGDYAAQHEVFFGTNWEDVNDMTDPCATKNLGQESYDAGANQTLDPGVTYYWRIDEVNGLETWKGHVWDFTINDGNAFDPAPADGEMAVPIDATLSWFSGCLAASHDVYFGTDYNEVGAAEGASNPNVDYNNVIINSYDPNGNLEYLTWYYWRVDAVNGPNTWRGKVWSLRSQTEIIDVNNVLWYRLDETEGYIAHDSSNYLHDGIVDMPESGPPVWEPSGGQWGGSLVFDDDTAVWVPTTVLRNLSYGITVIFWANEADKKALNANGGDSQLLVDFDGDDGVEWRAGNVTNDVLTWTNTITPEWHHWAFVKNESEGYIKIYCDGAPVMSDDVVDITLANIRNKPFKIGGETAQDNDFEGKMDDFIVYDRALSDNEIARQYESEGPVGKAGLAWRSRPRNRATDVDRWVVLTWNPGDFTGDPNAHEIYLGTSWDDVNDANNSLPVGTSVYKGVQALDSNSYEPCEPLDLGQTYYWRIDQVNDANNDRWTGNVWRFTVGNFITIDDFDDDTAQNPPSNDWYEIGSADISLRTTPPVIGEHSMRYAYNNWFDFGPGYYSEIESISLEPNDWTILDQKLKILSLWFYGQSGNAATITEQMYVYLKDNDSNEFQVKYGDADWEDMTDIQIEDWQEWLIPLSRFSTNDVNLANLDNLCIGFGIRGNTTNPGMSSMGVVYFDNIRLHPVMCIPSLRTPPEVDLNGDCEVDFEDVEIMADEWLEVDVNLSPVQPPSEPNLVGWWKLDDGAGSIVTDYAGYDNNGVIETIDVNAWWVSGYDGNALEFDGGRVRVPDAQNLRPLHQVSVCAWIYYSDEQDTARLVVKGADNKECYDIEVSDDDELVFMVRDGNDYYAADDEYKDYAAESNEVENPLDRHEWIHVAGTYDGNTVKCYINGELAAENNDPNISAIPFLSQDTNDLAIGNMSDDDRAPFEGTIDDIRVYNYGLSAGEVAYIATDETGIFTVHSAANLYNNEQLGDRAVNLRDFAELAKGWLEKKFWPFE
ncbi:MAG: LamG domain-containing protein [Planctomycetota bacterium]|jgi:hypothetical protein